MSSDSSRRYDAYESSSHSSSSGPSSSTFPFNSLVAAVSATSSHHPIPASTAAPSQQHPSAFASASTAAAATSTTPTVALGRTRCYWSILSPSLDYLCVDPILDTHLKDQKERFLGTNLLDYVHPEERDALRADLMPRPGDRAGGIERAGIFGSVTKCRYSRVPQIRRMLGCAEPETDPEAGLIAYDNAYLKIVIVTSWIGGGEPGLGGEAGDELHGAVLAFLHATEDKDERLDNDEQRRSHWSNWCGPHLEDGPYLDEVRCAELEAALARATSFDPTKSRSSSDGPPPHVFQILNHEGKPIVTFPPPMTPGYEYDPAEYAALGQQVVNKPRPAHESTTSCTRRYRDKHPMLKAGSLVSIESVVIMYGAITFCVFDTGGIYLTAAAKQKAAAASTLASPSSSKSSNSPGVSHAAKTFELEDVPLASGASPKRGSDGSVPYPEPPHKRPRVEAPLGPTMLHNPLRLDVSPLPSSNRLSPGHEKHNGGGLSPTVASSAAILGSFSSGFGHAGSPDHHAPHLPPAHHPHRSPFPPPGPYGGPPPLHHPQQHYPYPPPPPFAHPLYHQQHTAFPPQLYPPYPQHPLAPPQHPMMHFPPSQHPGYHTYPAPPLPPIGSPYGTQHHSPLPPPLHHLYAHPQAPSHQVSPHFSSEGSLPPPPTGISDGGSSTSAHHTSVPTASTSTAPSHNGATEASSSSAAGAKDEMSASKKDKAPAKPKGELPVATKPGPAACESCGTADSPEWRKGPSGNKSLCNACGLRYARQVTRQNKLAQAAASGEPLRKKGKKPKPKPAGLTEGEEAGGPSSTDHGPKSHLEDGFFDPPPNPPPQHQGSSSHVGPSGGYHLPSMHPSNGFDHPHPVDAGSGGGSSHHFFGNGSPSSHHHPHLPSMQSFGQPPPRPSDHASGDSNGASSYRPYEWSASTRGPESR